MKLVIIFLSAVVCCLAYETQWDHYDFETRIKDPEYVRNALGCYVDENECDEANKFFKGIAIEALTTACARCTTEQKKMIKLLMSTGYSLYPELISKLVEKYDPEGQYVYQMYQALLDV